MGSTHPMAGFVIWFSMMRANISPPLGIIVVVLGSLLPDIDPWALALAIPWAIVEGAELPDLWKVWRGKRKP